ncbi:MAG: hypothetical protein ACK4N4_08190, partial [Burkholderiales bacterium]
MNPQDSHQTRSFTLPQLIGAASQGVSLSAGDQIVFLDERFNGLQPHNWAAFIEELSKLFNRQRACLCTEIPEDSIKVLALDPVSLLVLKPLTIHCATRSNWLLPSLTPLTFRCIEKLHDTEVIPRST